MDELGKAAAFGLNLPHDLQRYERLQEPDWDVPIREWMHVLLPLSPEEIAELDLFAVELRGFEVSARASEPHSAIVEQAAAEAGRIMRYLDLYAACTEAYTCASQLDSPTRRRLIEDITGSTDSETGLAELVRLLADLFLSNARETWAKVRIEGAPADWDHESPWVRRGTIAAVRANSSF